MFTLTPIRAGEAKIESEHICFRLHFFSPTGLFHRGRVDYYLLHDCGAIMDPRRVPSETLGELGQLQCSHCERELPEEVFDQPYLLTDESLAVESWLSWLLALAGPLEGALQGCEVRNLIYEWFEEQEE